MNPPTVSILLPTYNYARFLPEAIESVLRQEFSDFELIISDDASSDGSAEIIRAFAARDVRIRATVQPVNLGLVANWNWCLGQARGHFVKYLFGDDCFATPHAVQRWVSLLTDNPSAALAVSARQVIDDNSRVVDHWSHLPGEGLHEGRATVRQCLLRTNNFIGEPTAVMFRREAAQRGFDQRYRQIVDLEMWCHLLKSGDVAYTHEPLCSFRRHGSQQSEANRQEQVGSREYSRLLSTYLDHYVPPGTEFSADERKYLFSAIYHLRKGRSVPEELRAIERVFLPKLGRGHYFFLWMIRRVTRPFINLRRHWEKFRARFHAELNQVRDPNPQALPATPRIPVIRRSPVRFFSNRAAGSRAAAKRA